MAKGKKGGDSNSARNNGKASKKSPKVFDATKRRLVSAK
jgi:hypothetical protein